MIKVIFQVEESRKENPLSLPTAARNTDDYKAAIPYFTCWGALTVGKPIKVRLTHQKAVDLLFLVFHLVLTPLIAISSVLVLAEDVGLGRIVSLKKVKGNFFIT